MFWLSTRLLSNFVKEIQVMACFVKLTNYVDFCPLLFKSGQQQGSKPLQQYIYYIYYEFNMSLVGIEPEWGE